MRRWTRSSTCTTRIHGASQDDPQLEVGWDPQLTRRGVPAADGEDEAQLAELLARINATKRVFLSTTLVRGEYWLRVCIVSHRTHADRIDECRRIIRKAAAALGG